MCTVTATELKRNFGKYNELAQKEEIVVTSHGKAIYTITPMRQKIYKEAMSLVGFLPKDATIGIDPDERG